MDREIIVKRLGEMTLTICEMQDVINKLSAENAELRAQLQPEDREQNGGHVGKPPAP